MDRLIGRFLHESTNATYWMEKPGWSSGNTVADMALRGLRSLPFSVHDAQKRLVFKEGDNVTVSGESVVTYQEDTVRKYMFRYPLGMPLDTFYYEARKEVATVTDKLGGIALPTTLRLTKADIFNKPFGPVIAPVQIQRRLDTMSNPSFTLNDMHPHPKAAFEKTVRDLDALLQQTDQMIMDDGYYPEVAFSSGNLRRDVYTGDITLVDVMPLRQDGTRLIGDSPSKLPHTLDALKDIGAFVGKFGS